MTSDHLVLWVVWRSMCVGTESMGNRHIHPVRSNLISLQLRVVPYVIVVRSIEAICGICYFLSRISDVVTTQWICCDSIERQGLLPWLLDSSVVLDVLCCFYWFISVPMSYSLHVRSCHFDWRILVSRHFRGFVTNSLEIVSLNILVCVMAPLALMMTRF
jgi:hypothetical protein